jgi:protocatechuate 3,4-dioxygenase beta subunit
MTKDSISAVHVEGSNWDLAPDFSKRIPTNSRVKIPADLFQDSSAAALAKIPVTPEDSDLTKQCEGEPIGQRILIEGRVLDDARRPLANALIEVWQCNAAGTYRDFADPGDAPVDPNFIGKGRCLTNADGEYRLITIKPASYPGPAGTGIPYRPAHVHVSVIGHDIKQRLITQVYFQGDPLFENDFVTGMVSDPEERSALLASYAPELTVHGGPDRVMGYRWDVILGSNGTPMEW